MVTGTSGAVPDAGVLAVLRAASWRSRTSPGGRCSRAWRAGGDYEPVLTGVLVVSVVAGLAIQLA